MLRCSYILPDGRNCRNLARRHHSVCRHHSAQALGERTRRAMAAPPPALETDGPHPRSDYTAYWHGYHAVIRQSDESEFDDILSSILAGFDQGVLSDRSAGRLLATLVQRRRQLRQQRLNEQLMRLAEQHRALRQTGISARGLHEMLAPQLHEMMGLRSEKPTL